MSRATPGSQAEESERGISLQRQENHVRGELTRGAFTRVRHACRVVYAPPHCFALDSKRDQLGLMSYGGTLMPHALSIRALRGAV